MTEQEDDFLVGAHQGDVDKVSTYIKSGLSLNIQDDVIGWSALHHAVASGQLEVVQAFQALWQNKDNHTYLSDNFGITPLHLSVMLRNHEITDFLLKNNFPLLPDNFGEYAWEKINVLDSSLYKIFVNYFSELYKKNNKTNKQLDLLEHNSPEFFRRRWNCKYLKFDFGKLDKLVLTENLNEILIIPEPQPETHPQLEEVIKKSAQWMVNLKLTSESKKIAAARFPALVQSTLCFVKSEVLEVVGEFFATSFIIDDVLEKQWQNFSREEDINDILDSFLRFFRYPDNTDITEYAFPNYKNVCAAIQNISLRFKNYSEGMDLNEFYKSLDSYFRSCISIYINRRKEIEYSDETFSFFRKFTLGLPAAIELCLVFYKINLSEEERNNPILNRIKEAALRAYATLNDIFSYYKELLEEKKPENLIAFKKQKYEKKLGENVNTSINESLMWKAFKHAVKKYNKEMRDILRLNELLPSNPNFKIYYEILIKLLRDNVDWHLSQAKVRYLLTNFVSKEFDTAKEAIEFKLFEESNDNQTSELSQTEASLQLDSENNERPQAGAPTNVSGPKITPMRSF